MAKTKLDLQSKDDNELENFAKNHDSKMENNPNFPTPEPSKAEFETALTEYSTALAEHKAAQDTAKEKLARKNEKRSKLEGALTDRAAYVDLKAKGNEEKAFSAGFEVRAVATAVGILPAPINFLATMGDMQGEVDLSWDPIKGTKVYMVEYRLHDEPNQPWVPAKPTSRSSTTVTGLVSGKNYGFRVRTMSAAGEGPWSDETVKMAP